MRVLALLLTASLLASSVAAAERVRVVIPSGAVSGVRGDGFDSFKGIPYAAPPVGPLRWQKPQPAAGWSGDLDAADFGPSCMQASPPTHIVPGSPGLTLSEDCLRLNIWVPAGAKKAPGGRLPVMVWIHGGGNDSGSPADFFMDGQNLAKDGVILVSVNYRLGLLGFFAWPGLGENGKVTANFGLWDQVAALKWVKANIAAFGGDPDNVTLFGESAGGEDTIALLASPAAKGLFNKAIVESGGGGWGPAADIVDQQKTLSAKFTGKTLADLRALPAADLVKQKDDSPTDPVVDHDLLAETPLQAFADGSASHVPLIIGTNNAEGSLLGQRPVDPAKLFDQLTAADLTAVRAAYGDQAKDDNTFARLLFRDGYFAGPARFIARHDSGYLYRFSYVLAPLQSRRAGAWHGSEVPFIFDRWPIDDLNATDHTVEAAIHGAWLAFAKTGQPGWQTLNASGEEMRFDATPSPQAPDDQTALDVLEKHLSPIKQP